MRLHKHELLRWKPETVCSLPLLSDRPAKAGFHLFFLTYFLAAVQVGFGPRYSHNENMMPTTDSDTGGVHDRILKPPRRNPTAALFFWERCAHFSYRKENEHGRSQGAPFLSFYAACDRGEPGSQLAWESNSLPG